VLIADQQQRLQDGQVWSYFDSAMRILSNQVLTEVGTIKLPWQPDTGDLIVHRVEIIRGTEHIDLIAQGQKFQVLRREEQLEQLQMTGVRTATLAVEGLRVGDVLRMSFSITNKDPALKGNVQTMVGLPADPMRIGFARARLSWPVGSDLHLKSFASGLNLTPVAKDGFNEVEIALPLAKQPEIPNDAPGRYQRPPILEAASFADWTSVSKTVAPLYATDGLIAPGSPLAAEVAKIASASTDPRVRAATALQLVQDKVRYLFKGMDGGNYVPQKPADTWTLRYGDCKAKTLLLLAILRGLDIEAEPVLAQIGMGDLTSARLPSMGAFNHILVHATIGGKDLYLDGTGNGDRLADLDDVPPFGNVLPVRAAGATLVKLPARANARAEWAADVALDQSAGLSLPTAYKITVRLRGQMAEMARVIATQGGKEQRDNMVRTIIGPYIDDPLIADRTVTYDEKDATTVVTASGLMTTPWKFENERFRAQIDHAVNDAGFSPDRARPAWKDIPVATQAPGTRTVHTQIRLPAGATGYTLDGATALTGKLAGVELSRTSSLANGLVTIDERIAPTGEEIASADIPATRQAVALAQTKMFQVVAPADAPSHWQEVAAAKSDAHRFDAIRAAYAKVIADTPDKAQPYTNRASFLAGIYEWKAAIADLDKALTFEPDADTYRWRGRLYAAIGDDAKALADAKTAWELDPDAGLESLANAYAEAGQIDAAVKLVDERIAAGGKERFRYMALKSDLLARTGKTDEALSAIDTAIAGSPGSPELLNARCWLKGTMNVALDTALKDCTRSIELADSPVAALDSRAMVYFRMNRFDDALADLQAAIDLSRGMAASMYMRGIIRKRMGNAQGDADLTAARMMSPAIDRDYARWGIKP